MAALEPEAPVEVAFAVAVLDRDHWSARTDNLAVVDGTARRLISIPRDLWCEILLDRINLAYAKGGAGLLVEALAEHGFRVDGVLCVMRSAIERALRDVHVTVLVDRRLRFLYPRTPTEPIEDGAKEVRFEPPSEVLHGERLHQWMGARVVPGGVGSDLHRIARQQTLLRRLLEEKFDFQQLLEIPELFRVHGSNGHLDEVAQVDHDWSFSIFDAVVPGDIGGKNVLVSRTSARFAARTGSTAATGTRLVSKLVHRVALKAAIPSSGFDAPVQRVRLLAVLAVRNESRYLPGWLHAVLPHVDGVVALDDGSTDETGEMLERHSEVLEVIRRPPSRPRWNEVANHRSLVAAACRHGADWIIALDADERPEIDFRARTERVIRRGARFGAGAFALRLFELWGSRSIYRADGIWGRKTVARLFRARQDHLFDPKPLHGHKAPLQAMWLGRFPIANLYLYHLRMIHPSDRLARRRRYESLDPGNRLQPGVDYAYLTDENGLRLKGVPPGRGFDDGV